MAFGSEHADRSVPEKCRASAWIERLERGLDVVLEVQTYGDLIHVFVQDAETGQAAVTQALEAAGIAISDLRQTHPRMEEAFISLIRRQGASDQDAEALLNAVNHK